MVEQNKQGCKGEIERGEDKNIDHRAKCAQITVYAVVVRKTKNLVQGKDRRGNEPGEKEFSRERQYGKKGPASISSEPEAKQE